MKLNWGHRIFLLYMSFVVLIGILVYKSTREHFDLVSEDYYDKGVKFQNQINEEQNTFSLKEKPKSIYNKSEDVVELKFPESIHSTSVNGEIKFFKPDNASLDFSVKINLNENNLQRISSNKLTHGYWRLKTTWSANNTNYYQEENLYIN